MDEAFACEVGTLLWEEYRKTHLDAPVEPPEAGEDLPDAVEYWNHVQLCDDCNEV